MSGHDPRQTARTVGALALLTAALPANLALTAAALARTALRPPPAPPVPDRRRTVLVSGGKMTKALQLCRSFHAAGHRVILVETAAYRLTGHRFSRAVDAFHVVPRPEDPGYAQALLDVVRAEGVDLYVPVCSPAASRYDADAAALLAPHCEVLHLDGDAVRMLDDKYEFARTAAKLGLDVPDTHLVTSADDVPERVDGAAAPYVLKNLAYDPVNRLDLTPLPRPTPERTLAFARSKPISPERPWIVQSLLAGQEYCTHSTVRDGRVLVWACCASSAFQVNYAMVEQPEIERWVRDFVGPLRLTGQVSFDFIAGPDGRVRAIECNPRTHSAITMFHDHPDLAAAYLGELGDTAPLRPLPGSRPTYWLYHELWRVLRRPSTAAERWRVVRAGTDAVFDRDDPLPFLLVHHLQVPVLLLRALRRGTRWTRIDFNIGKLVEPGGD
ncbi:Predicted ATP-dependent carboligase, ATP-grasp superfamily [Jatrophihabitans endophyticus]|uniref:Predicted ATP-dependent carboligase, ATP-grasp superfamily n=1 Tax=Jatrophihabitans endophyticus TaxID=1206085 RepID=A0A1M5U3F8_9ACTN|nr:ATP-grasp enzyme [Jatrophihabitans endophyticus]SHH57396.1 Predicted ATP-dependent carboligase, ATP-grasp superfamily [Jatrophihabitans endophyticus]